MQTIIDFVVFLLGFAPLIGIALTITALVWAATKLFPTFGVQMETATDRMFGVDADYDEKYNTGNASTTYDQYV